MITHTQLFVTKITLTCALVFLATLTLIACKSEAPSTSSNGANTANVSASPEAAPRVTVPSTVPTAPVGPVGQTTPSGQPTPSTPDQASTNKDEKSVTLTEGMITRSPAKPMLTPAPDPFPARPTPTVVMADGKIKQQWAAPAEAASLVNPFKDQANAAQLGREFYMQKCVDCHGKEGKGNGYMAKMVAKPPTNLASQMVQANSDGELFWKITNGRSPMPAHRIRFTDEQRWYIVAFLRTFKP
jgi:mono/diheme cytochrome c family protein